MIKSYCLVILVFTSFVPISRYIRISVIVWIPLVFHNGCKVPHTSMVTFWTQYSPMVFAITDIEIGDSGFSDHEFLTFSTALPRRSSTTSAQARWVCYFCPTASEDFASSYKADDDFQFKLVNRKL